MVDTTDATAVTIFTALDEQTVVVAGTGAGRLVLAQLTIPWVQLRKTRSEVFESIKGLVQSESLFQLLTSMPAVGVRSTARILTEVAGKGLVI